MPGRFFWVRFPCGQAWRGKTIGAAKKRKRFRRVCRARDWRGRRRAAIGGPSTTIHFHVAAVACTQVDKNAVRTMAIRRTYLPAVYTSHGNDDNVIKKKKSIVVFSSSMDVYYFFFFFSNVPIYRYGIIIIIWQVPNTQDYTEYI